LTPFNSNIRESADVVHLNTIAIDEKINENQFTSPVDRTKQAQSSVTPTKVARGQFIPPSRGTMTSAKKNRKRTYNSTVQDEFRISQQLDKNNFELSGEDSEDDGQN
jgi:hypothetical protein